MNDKITTVAALKGTKLAENLNEWLNFNLNRGAKMPLPEAIDHAITTLDDVRKIFGVPLTAKDKKVVKDYLTARAKELKPVA